MPVRAINPYLSFNGESLAAIAFYEKAIDAKVVELMRFSDAPGSRPPDKPDGVMHAQLDTGAGTMLLSDGMQGGAGTRGEDVWVCLQYDGTGEVDRHFNGLAEGGVIVQPLQDTFWGARFGLLVDKFGIHWMFNAKLTA